MLTIDLGNSRCKLRTWRIEGNDSATAAHAPEGGVELETAGELPARAAQWVRRAGSLAAAALSSVAAPSVTARLVQAIGDVLGGVAVLEPGSGLEVRCREPGEVGRDRLFAARGACEALGGSAIVVDLGTALTVDAVRREGAGAGAFLGGAIAPGPTLLARALARGASRLPAVVPEPGVRALGTDTRAAIAAGVVVGLRGAAAALTAEVAREAGLDHAPVALTGGGRAFLLEPRPFTDLLGGERALHELPDLVHLGLLHALLDTIAAGGPS